jgi:hypothetical protein
MGLIVHMLAAAAVLCLRGPDNTDNAYAPGTGPVRMRGFLGKVVLSISLLAGNAAIDPLTMLSSYSPLLASFSCHPQLPLVS